MKNVVKCYKDFFGYFNALKTHSEYTTARLMYILLAPYQQSKLIWNPKLPKGSFNVYVDKRR